MKAILFVCHILKISTHKALLFLYTMLEAIKIIDMKNYSCNTKQKPIQQQKLINMIQKY